MAQGYWGGDITGELLRSQRWAGPDKLIGGVFDVIAAFKLDAAKRKQRKARGAMDEELDAEMAVQGGPAFGKKQGGRSLFEDMDRPEYSRTPALDIMRNMHMGAQLQQEVGQEKQREAAKLSEREFEQKRILQREAGESWADRYEALERAKTDKELTLADRKREAIRAALAGGTVPPPLVAGLGEAPTARMEYPGATPEPAEVPKGFGQKTPQEQLESGIWSLIRSGNTEAARELAPIYGSMVRESTAGQTLESRERIAGGVQAGQTERKILGETASTERKILGETASTERKIIGETGATGRKVLGETGATERVRQQIAGKWDYLNQEQKFKAAEAVQRAQERVELENVRLGNKIRVVGEQGQQTIAAIRAREEEKRKTSLEAGAAIAKSLGAPLDESKPGTEGLVDAAQRLAGASEKALREGNLPAAQEAAKLAKTYTALANAAKVAKEEDDSVEQAAINDYWVSRGEGDTHAEAMTKTLTNYSKILPPVARRRIENLKDFNEEPDDILDRTLKATRLAIMRVGEPGLEEKYEPGGMDRYRLRILEEAATVLQEKGDVPARDAVIEGKLGWTDITKGKQTGEPPPLVPPPTGATNEPPPLVPGATDSGVKMRSGKVGKYTWTTRD